MAPDTLSLTSRITIITGSGRENGIGAGIARALARNGCRVMLNYVSAANAPRAAALAASLQSEFFPQSPSTEVMVSATQADVSSPEGCAALVAATARTFGTERVDILVTNAACSDTPQTLIDIQPHQLHSNFATAVFGPVYLIQAVAPKMPYGQGRIVNVGSVASKVGNYRLPVYSVAERRPLCGLHVNHC